MNISKEIEAKISKLPPEFLKELKEYLDYLLSRSREKTGKNTLKQNWGGGLKEFRDKFTAKDLQKKSLNWRK